MPHSPVAPANSIEGAAVLVLRDPDNIQLELFYEPPTHHDRVDLAVVVADKCT